MVSRKFAGVFVDPNNDPRADVPSVGDERALLVAHLRWQRGTLELKCSGLGAADLARRSVEPATLSLLGLVRHLAEVERRWFRRGMAGLPAPPIFCTDTEPDGDFDGAVPDPDVVAQSWAAWRSEVDFADRFVAQAPDLCITGSDPWRQTMSLRWVLIHLIEEYARHNGHADLLRQCIDGRVGH